MIVGREKEIELLKGLLEEEESQFVAIYGRRRVGKTFLIREAFNYSFAFQHTGIYGASLKEQLSEFTESLYSAGMRKVKELPSNWNEAFHLLERFIEKSKDTQKKKIIFIDEMPWMDTPRSKFVTALEFFWNGWAAMRNDVLLIVCGSATSWIINKIFRNHGGLHNRVNYQIFLEPFTLHECEEYSEAMGFAYSRYDLLEAYMVMGGVPYYWSLMEKGKSLAQNIDSLFFAPQGLLHYEFRELYDSLFRNSEPYIDVVNVLGKKLGGMRREEIVSSLGVTDSGNLSRVLEDLEHSGFIIRTNSYGAKKYNAIYRLMDNFSLFYLKFMKENRTDDPEFWSHNYTSPLRYSWCGLAFERVCFQHIPQIKQALGFLCVVTNTYSWQVKDDEIYGPGAQIDMLIERADNTINICEMKFSQNEFVIDKDYDANLRHKLARFGDSISRRKTLRLTMVTTYGVVHNAYWNRVQSEVVSDDLLL